MTIDKSSTSSPNTSDICIIKSLTKPTKVKNYSKSDVCTLKMITMSSQKDEFEICLKINHRLDFILGKG